ncbi:alpha-ketoglutarate-dependent dioxygenase alkB-like, partial [Phalaenopsis equestris]
MYGMSETVDATAPVEVDAERTAFRRTEKLYKLYKTEAPKRRKNLAHRKTDLSGVVDFHSVLKSFRQDGATPAGIFKYECKGFRLPVFCFEKRP